MELSQVINQEANPIPTKIISSVVAVPVDLQFHNLSEADAVPIRQVGKFTTEEKVMTNEVIGAGITKNFIFDVSDCSKFYIAVVASVSHSFSVRAQWMSSAESGYIVFVTDSSDTKTVIPSTTKKNFISDEVVVKSSNVRLQFANAHTESVTYNVFLYKQRV